MKIMLSEPLLDALREVGIADDSTRRVVIDIQVGHVPLVHIERYGDERLIKVARALAGVEVRRDEIPVQDPSIRTVEQPHPYSQVTASDQQFATGGPVDSSKVYRVGEDRNCGYLTPEKLKAARDRMLNEPSGAESLLAAIPVKVDPALPADVVYVMADCGCGHPATSHGRSGCSELRCLCSTSAAKLAAKITGIGTED